MEKSDHDFLTLNMLVMKFRGDILHNAIVVENLCNLIISRYFGGYGGNKEIDFFYSILSKQSFSFYMKTEVVEYLITNRTNKEFIEKIKKEKLHKKFETLQSTRNKVAHYTFNADLDIQTIDNVYLNNFTTDSHTPTEKPFLLNYKVVAEYTTICSQVVDLLKEAHILINKKSAM